MVWECVHVSVCVCMCVCVCVCVVCVRVRVRVCARVRTYTRPSRPCARTSPLPPAQPHAAACAPLVLAGLV